MVLPVHDVVGPHAAGCISAVAAKGTDWPEQILVSAVTNTFGASPDTVTVTVAERLQPAGLVAVTVYEVVVSGDAITELPVVLLRPVAGVHA